MSVTAIRNQSIDFTKPLISKAFKYTLVALLFTVAWLELSNHWFAVLSVFSVMATIIYQRAKTLDSIDLDSSEDLQTLSLKREKFYDGGTFSVAQKSEKKSATKNIVYDGGMF